MQEEQALESAAPAFPTDSFDLLCAELKSLGGFAALVLCCVVLLAAGAYIRNTVWEDAGRLWLDITDKVYVQRILDPALQREAPRSERGRIYNNIGLYLYDQGRFLLNARRGKGHIETQIQRLEGIPDKSADLLKQLEDLKSKLAEADEGIEKYTEAAIRCTPREFKKDIVRLGVTAQNQDWDSFIPAELCLDKALYHRPTYYIARLNMGLVNKLRNNLSGAEEHFRLAHTYFPRYEKALRYHAQVLLQMNEFEEALQFSIRAMRLTQHLGSFAAAAEASYALQYYTQAVGFTQKLLELNPSLGSIYRLQAEIYMDMKQPQKALQALMVIRQNFKPMLPQVAMIMADALAQTGQMQRLDEFATQMEKEYPYTIAGEKVRSTIALYAKEYPRAYSVAARASKRDPQDWEAWYLQARALQLGGKTEDAATAYKSAIRRNPRKAEIWRHLTSALLDLKRLDEARHTVVQYLILRPRDQQAIGIRERLEASLRKTTPPSPSTN